MSLKATTLLTAAICLVLAAMFLQIDQLYFMSAAIMGIALVSRLAVMSGLRGLRCERQVIDRVFEDDVVSVSLQVENISRWPKIFLQLEDEFSPWLCSEEARFLLPSLWPRQQITLRYTCRPQKRGVHKVGPLKIIASDPIGLLTRSRVIAPEVGAIIYPRPITLPAEDITGGALFGKGAAERSARTGEGLDFHGVRDYKPGDELRRIHWKASARHQRLAVIEYEQSHTSDVAIALDLLKGTEAGAGLHTTLEYGVKIAVSLARRALDSGAMVSLSLQGAGGYQHLLCRGEEDFHQILEMLARAEATGEAPLYALLEKMRISLLPGTVVVAITSDPDPRLAGAAQSLGVENLQLSTVLLNAHSFNAAGGGTRDLLPPPAVETLSPAPSPYVSLVENLRQMGTKAHLINQGEDLVQAIRRIIGGEE
jgi:uncharacterized protein (DUF58 family)